MKELRKVDDNIHIRINGLPRGPNLQDHCKAFCAQLLDSYALRDRWIQGCIGVLDKEVEAQKEVLSEMESPDPRQQNLVAELERKARLMRNESTVDGILRERTADTIRRRCMLRMPTSTVDSPVSRPDGGNSA
ncbi:hypothetical protein BCR44DRAFT_57501 [Catenaria anguillulae PL171]|uniref:Uncharacterized protein n=1 Tax=Catenaria anguillulae PL171 TaxID=765915 RepID=A0A1Y2I126_9FUNG|nr:hypothetical protein BCR44DRAFT_57501 [Catenaria anguillulae PL171]